MAAARHATDGGAATVHGSISMDPEANLPWQGALRFTAGIGSSNWYSVATQTGTTWDVRVTRYNPDMVTAYEDLVIAGLYTLKTSSFFWQTPSGSSGTTTVKAGNLNTGIRISHSGARGTYTVQGTIAFK